MKRRFSFGQQVKKGFSNSKTKESFGEDRQANAQESTIAPQ